MATQWSACPLPESAVVAGELECAETAWCLGFDCWLAFLDPCWLIAVQIEAVMEAEGVAEMEAGVEAGMESVIEAEMAKRFVPFWDVLGVEVLY